MTDPGLPPIKPDDVPIADRWVCQTCGRVTRPGVPPIEHLLGGWVRVHCWFCGVVVVARPPRVNEQEDS
jgi:hypothetical protein